MKVFLIGMPGSGKSTFGREISGFLNLPFIDLDDEIEKKEKMQISEIFKREGEAHFRECESNTLNYFTSLKSGFVMATGGGAPCFFDNMELMLRSGAAVFLDIPISEISSRLKGDRKNNRPLLEEKTEKELTKFLSRMLERRSPFYKKAHFVYKGDETKLPALIALLKTHPYS